jgi:putative Ca2+/H+ antiporter (TMEM165/GDT1 family)
MDWKVIIAAFGLVFVAELGDKTQLAALNLSAKSQAPMLVFLGSVTAYALVTLVTVLLGGVLARFIQPDYIRYGAAVMFIVIGALILFGKI